MIAMRIRQLIFPFIIYRASIPNATASTTASSAKSACVAAFPTPVKVAVDLEPVLLDLPVLVVVVASVVEELARDAVWLPQLTWRVP